MSEPNDTAESDPALRAAFECLPDGIVILDRHLRVTWCNAAAFEIWGLPGGPGPVPARFDHDAEVVDEDLNPVSSLFDAAAAVFTSGRACKNKIIGLRRIPRGLRWFSVSAVPVRGTEDRSFDRVVMTFRKLADDDAVSSRLETTHGQLFDRQRFLDTTLNALPCLVSYVDRDYVYRYCNKAYEDWFLVKSQDFVGRPVVSMLGEGAFLAVRPHLDRAFSGRASVFETEIDYKHQGLRSISANYIPSVESDGRIVGAYCIILDITAQVSARNLVAQNERDISKLVNSIPALIGWWDRDQRNLLANTAYNKYFGVSATHLKGRTMREFLGDDLYAKNQIHVDRVLRGEPQNFERQITTPEGETKHLLANYIPDVSDGRVRGFFAVVTDVSPLKIVEERQRQVESKLIANAKMAALGEMAGGVAHEINNPLAIIHGKAGQIQRALRDDDFDPAAIAVEVAKIEATATRISKIVQGLRSFSRNAEADPMVLASAGQIVRETLDLVQEKFRHAGARVTVSGAMDSVLECRPVEISQVLMNLLLNGYHAIQWSAEKWITIEIHADAEAVQIQVTDSGTGIAPDVAGKIMQPFFTTKDVGQGTGLGLSISRGIAEAHQGRLTLVPYSAHTRFVLDLPRRQNPP